jgi:hypothetical protein
MPVTRKLTTLKGAESGLSTLMVPEPSQLLPLLSEKHSEAQVRVAVEPTGVGGKLMSVAAAGAWAGERRGAERLRRPRGRGPGRPAEHGGGDQQRSAARVNDAAHTKFLL